MDFKTYWQGLSPARKKEFAAEANTSSGYCHQVAFGKRVSLGMADAFVAVAAGALTLDDIPLTEDAQCQRVIRTRRPPRRRSNQAVPGVA